MNKINELKSRFNLVYNNVSMQKANHHNLVNDQDQNKKAFIK